MTVPVRCLLAAVSVLAIATPAASSPATDLLNALKARLEETYFPPAGVDVARIMDDAARKLAVACDGQGDSCSTETGLEVVRAAVAELGDRHVSIMRAPTPPPDTAGPGRPPAAGGPGPGPGAGPGAGGPPAQRLPLGMSTRAVRGQDYIYVAWVSPDGPAGKAGLRRYDRVIPPSGITAGMLNSATAPVSVTVERGGQTFEAVLTPDPGQSSAGPQMSMVGDVAVIHFPSGTGDGMAQVGHDLLAQAKASNARAVVLDLRDNGGGGLQCAAMTSAFTDYKSVMRGRRDDTIMTSVTLGRVVMGPAGTVEPSIVLERPTRWTGPLAVLVNENTASCSESMAIQIERAGRGLVVGEQTYGVGNNTLRPAPLTDGWAIQLTAFYTETEAGQRLPPRPPLAIELEDDPIAIGKTGRDAVLQAALAHLATMA